MNTLFVPFDIVHRFYTVNQCNDLQSKKESQKRGKRYAKKCHCVIASLLRDAASSFSVGVKNIESFSEIFKSVDVFILENGSKDNCRKLWKDYAKKCPRNVKIFVESPKKGKYPKTINHNITTTRIKKW